MASVTQRVHPRREVGRSHSTVITYAMGTLLLLVVAAPYITYKPQPFTGEGNSMRQLSYILIFLAVICGAQYYKQPRRLLVLPMSISVTLLWCWISLSWSISPDIGVRRAILTTVIILTIFLAVQHVGFDRTLVVIRAMMIPVLIANYIAVIGWPSSGIHQVQEVGGDPGLIGNWRGFLLQKNFAGAFCAFTIMFYVFDARYIRSILRFTVLVASMLFLYETKSKTSMALLGLSLMLGYVFKRYNPRFRRGMFFGLFVLLSAMSIFGYEEWDLIVAPFSGEDALTGRVQIWPVLLAYWREHWLGAGFGSFWNIGPDSPIFQYGKGWVVDLGNGHNGYLDLLTQVGLPGLLLVISAFFVWPLCRLLGSLALPRRKGALLIAVLVFCAGHNMTETSLLDRDAIVQVFLVFTLALINVATSPQRQAHTRTDAQKNGLGGGSRPKHIQILQKSGRRHDMKLA